MKTITTSRFVRILGHNGVTQIEIKKIATFQEKALMKNIWCDFQEGAFVGLKNEYPMGIEFSTTAVVIKNKDWLLKQLDNRLLYNKDEDLDSQTIKIWKTLKEF